MMTGLAGRGVSGPRSFLRRAPNLIGTWARVSYLMVAGSPAGGFKVDLSLYLDVLEINSSAVFCLAAPLLHGRYKDDPLRAHQ